ncbi:non-specific lipid transfer protein GPI-anchored 14-like [Zingiber officinale]|uniref:non-specific lipid transfer protein GPI-anchored 14-like n=1 Tax=Zingiber officinale TaxID=94328 RepID=UPI001C4D9F35|nr:non-specific lipid transfer protein GPI-anchored 14-like [Zingiber officinale]
MATNVVFSSSSASLARLLPLLLLYSFSLILPGGSDSASDFAECGSALVGLQTCISYVQGAAAAPTPDCCGGLKDVLAQSPRCLCVLIKDRDDPQLPVKINVTRALALPTACSAAANVSKCPKLLNLPPNSPEAQVFGQSANSTIQAKGNSTARTGTGTGNSPRPTPETSHGGRGWTVETEAVAGCLLYFVLFLVAT